MIIYALCCISCPEGNNINHENGCNAICRIPCLQRKMGFLHIGRHLQTSQDCYFKRLCCFVLGALFSKFTHLIWTDRSQTKLDVTLHISASEIRDAYSESRCKKTGTTSNVRYECDICFWALLAEEKNPLSPIRNEWLESWPVIFLSPTSSK